MIEVKIWILPKTKRAKERVKSHGREMLLKEKKHDSILVESLGNTWRGEKWMGWFTNIEADFRYNDPDA